MGAVSAGLAILPFRIDHTRVSESLDYLLSTQQWLDATGQDWRVYVPELVQGVKRLLEGLEG